MDDKELQILTIAQFTHARTENVGENAHDLLGTPIDTIDGLSVLIWVVYWVNLDFFVVVINGHKPRISVR